MKMFRFFSGTHEEIFVHFGMFRSYFVSLFISEVGDAAGIHLDSTLDGGLLLEVLDYQSNTSGTDISL